VLFQGVCQAVPSQRLNIYLVVRVSPSFVLIRVFAMLLLNHPEKIRLEEEIELCFVSGLLGRVGALQVPNRLEPFYGLCKRCKCSSCLCN